jgi:hypothetical protein
MNRFMSSEIVVGIECPFEHRRPRPRMRLGISLNRVENDHAQSIAILPVRKLWKMVAIASAGSISSSAMTDHWPMRRAKNTVCCAAERNRAFRVHD